jgi:hypothetical protein
MASIASITFDQALYTPGQTITLTVDYTPDSPPASVVTSQATVTISQAVVVTAQESAPFEVSEPQVGVADVVAVTDTGGRTWTQQSNTSNPDGTATAVFTATA